MRSDFPLSAEATQCASCMLAWHEYLLLGPARPVYGSEWGRGSAGKLYSTFLFGVLALTGASGVLVSRFNVVNFKRAPNQ